MDNGGFHDMWQAYTRSLSEAVDKVIKIKHLLRKCSRLLSQVLL